MEGRDDQFQEPADPCDEDDADPGSPGSFYYGDWWDSYGWWGYGWRDDWDAQSWSSSRWFESRDEASQEHPWEDTENDLPAILPEEVIGWLLLRRRITCILSPVHSGGGGQQPSLQRCGASHATSR